MTSSTIDPRAVSVTGQLPGVENCVNCRAPVASDQRYCLACGERIGEPRVQVAPTQALASAEASSKAGSSPARELLAAALVLGVAALFTLGVIVGRENGASTTQTREPVVVRVQAGGSNSGAGGGGAVAANECAGAAKGKGRERAQGRDSQTRGRPPAAVRALDQASGEAYVKRSRKLPTTIVLPGKPPPKDNKPPGGGSNAIEIK